MTKLPRAQWRDDIFPPEVASMSIPNATYRFANGAETSPVETLTLQAANGTYQIEYSWHLDR